MNEEGLKENALTEKTRIEFMGVEKIWAEQGDTYRLRNKTKQLKKLENAVYTLEADILGFYLEKIENAFTFDHKLYGLETDIISRVVKTFAATNGNLGVLLNGVKGTGKTVTAKIICNKLNMPVILVPNAIPGCQFFLNGIPQDITIFIDEYEKVFKEESGDSTNMLTIMDGALNSEHRRMFVLTTNKLYINENLIQRPGRIRYLKTFSDLQPEVINEIIDDRLKYKKFKADAIKFISNLEIITVDIVNSIIDEINIHNEPPAAFKDVFNVKKLSGKHNIFLVDAEGKSTEFLKNVVIYPRKLDENEDHLIGNRFQAGNETLGRIVEVLGRNILKIQPDPIEVAKSRTLRKAKGKPSDLATMDKAEVSAEQPDGPKRKQIIVPPPFIIRVEDADVTNWKYKYGSSGDYLGMM